MRRALLAIPLLLSLLACGGGGGAVKGPPAAQGGGPAPGPGPAPGGGGTGGASPAASCQFTYDAAGKDRYPEGIRECYPKFPIPPPKKALLDRHIQLAQDHWSLVENSKVAILRPGTLTAAQILGTRLEAPHPPQVAQVDLDQDSALGPIHYHLRAQPYAYRDGEAYVDFANRQIGGGVMTRGFVQEEILMLETNFLPWVAALKARGAKGVSFCPDVPLDSLDTQPVVIKLRRFLEVAHVHEIYGRKLVGAGPFDPARHLVPLATPVDIYMPAMAAPNYKRGSGGGGTGHGPKPGGFGHRIETRGPRPGGRSHNPGSTIRKRGHKPGGPSRKPGGPGRHYTLAAIQDLMVLATRAFYDTLMSQDQDGKPLVIHTGNWGCGAYGNSKRTIWVVQRVALEAAYRLFSQATGKALDVTFHYDAFDRDSVRQANEASNVFSTWPEGLTLRDYANRVIQKVQSDPAGWEAGR
jgi:hypothetical protein